MVGGTSDLVAERPALPIAVWFRAAPRFAVSLGLLGLVFWMAPEEVDWTILMTIGPGALLVCLALSALTVALLAWRWKMVADRFFERPDACPRLGAYMGITWLSLATNQFVPTVVGGDVLRIGKLASWGLALPRATGAVLLDRLFGLVALGLLALTGLHLVVGGEGLRTALGAGLIVVLAGILIFALARRYGPPLWQGLFAAPLSWPQGAGLVFAAIVSHLANIAMFLIIAQAMGVGLPILPAIAIMSVTLFLSVLPVSIAGWGIRELSLVQAFGQIGVAAEGILLASVCYGLMVMITQAGGFLQLIGRNRP